MCGIAGISGPRVSSADADAAVRMCDAIQHRGPDNSGIFSQPGVCLGHRRLSIIDLSAGGHQPMTGASGRYTVVFNGEIYNYREVKNALPGFSFTTASDTEVLLAAWEKWGIDCLKRLHGMFAFALWDNAEQELWLVRDRFGVKPLYYAVTGDTLYFASEIRALAASGRVPMHLNTDALSEYFSWQTVMAPSTMVRGVYMLPCGTAAVWKKQELHLHKWWEVAAEVKLQDDTTPYNEVCATVRGLLLRSVERRMVSDVPVGAFLSGGIDSSAVVAMMSAVSDRPVDTFSVIFDEKEFDESRWSSLMAKRYNTRHHPIRVSPKEFLHLLPEALSAMDHPGGDGPNTYAVSKVTRAQGIKVALSGLGGDELFAGYPFFRRMADLNSRKWIGRVPRVLRSPAGALARFVPGGRRGEKIADVLSAESFSLEHQFPAYRRLYAQSLLKQLLLQESAHNPVDDWFHDHAEGTEKWPLLTRISAAEMGMYMQNVLLRDTDVMSMAHALEVREPFLDHELVTYVLGVKDSFKYPVTPKKLLTDAMQGDLPAEIIHRKKMGFTFPWAYWLRHDLSHFCTEKTKALDQRGILRPGAASEILRRFQAGDTSILWNHVWLLAVLEDWMERNGVQV